jgi:hypothetical protein
MWSARTGADERGKTHLDLSPLRRILLSVLLAGCALILSSAAAFGESDRVGTLPGGVRQLGAAPQPNGAPREPQAVLFDPFLGDFEERTFRFFWETANPKIGLVPDRYPTPSFASIAAVGFALTAYPIGVERRYITRAQAVERVLATLRFFMRAPNQHGFFYHFLDMKAGARANDSEISTVDTSLLLAGVLFCESYFDRQDPREKQIRKLANQLYRRVDWTWAQPRPPAVALAWTPQGGSLSSTGAATTRRCLSICSRLARQRTR